jgi:hypothetical protein
MEKPLSQALKTKQEFSRFFNQGSWFILVSVVPIFTEHYTGTLKNGTTAGSLLLRMNHV